MTKTLRLNIVAVAMMFVGATCAMAQGESALNSKVFNAGIEVGFKPIILMPKGGDNMTLMGGYVSMPMWGQRDQWRFGGAISLSYAQGSNSTSAYGISADTKTGLLNYGVSVNAGYALDIAGGKMRLTPFVGFYVDGLLYGFSKTEVGGTSTKVKLKDSKDMGNNAWDLAVGPEVGVRCQFSEHIYAKVKYGYSPYSFVSKQKDQRLHVGVGYLF